MLVLLVHRVCKSRAFLKTVCTSNCNCRIVFQWGIFFLNRKKKKKKKGILKRQPRTFHRQPILMCRQNKNWEPGRLKFENNFLLTFLGLDRGSACTPAGVSSRRSCMCCGSSYYLSRMGVSVSVNTVRCVRALSKNWQFFWRLVVSMIDMWDYYSLATVKVLRINLSHY